jgi:hypothetical protein
LGVDRLRSAPGQQRRGCGLLDEFHALFLAERTSSQQRVPNVSGRHNPYDDSGYDHRHSLLDAEPKFDHRRVVDREFLQHL